VRNVVIVTSLVELSAGELAFCAVVLLVASYIRGYSGFGFSAVLVAGATFVIEPVAAVPLALTFEVLASLAQGPSIWHEIRWPDFRLLLAAAIVGNPIGLVILTTVDSDVLRGVTLAVLLALTAGLLVNHSARVHPTPLLVFSVGVVAGVVNGATAMAGLVLVLAMSMAAISAAETRATLIAYFFASNLVVIVGLFVAGELTDELFWRVLLGIPLLVAGIVAGSLRFRSTSETAFRRVALWLLAAIAIVGLGSLLLA